MLHFFHNFKISCKGNKKHSNNQIKSERYGAHLNLMFIIYTCDVFNRLNVIPLTHPCNSLHAPKRQKLLAQGIRPGYSCPHAWRPERAKALYGTRGRRLRPALSPVSVSLSPVFGVIAGFLYLYRRFWSYRR